MFKVWILAAGESTYATNGLEFDTIQEAKTYAEDLFMRWYAMKTYAILPLEVAESGYLTQDFINENEVQS